MGTGCRHRTGRGIQCQRPEGSRNMHQTPQRWLPAWEKLPWIVDPSRAEQMKAPPLSSALTCMICYPFLQRWLPPFLLLHWFPFSLHSGHPSFHPKLHISYRHLHPPKPQRRTNSGNLPSTQGTETLKKSQDTCKEHPRKAVLSLGGSRLPIMFQ